MSKAETGRLILMMQQQFYEDMQYHFLALGNEGQYTESQKSYAFELIDEYGIRATARILQIPRRTLQRWCREYNVFVKRVHIGYLSGQKDAEKNERFGSGEDTFNNGNVAT